MNRSSGRNIVLNEGGRIGDDCIDNGDSAHVSIDICNVVRSIQMKANCAVGHSDALINNALI